MKTLLAICVICITSLLTACATPPSVNQVALIQIACNQDQIVRPIVTSLLPLATAAESTAVKLAEQAIDVVCANPTASPDANAQAAFNVAIGDVAKIEGALLARQVAAKQATP